VWTNINVTATARGGDDVLDLRVYIVYPRFTEFAKYRELKEANLPLPFDVQTLNSFQL